MYHVSMDLPFYIEEIHENDSRYLSPFISPKIIIIKDMQKFSNEEIKYAKYRNTYQFNN